MCLYIVCSVVDTYVIRYQSNNARETKHQVVENLDNLREVILERQKSRLLKKLMNTFTKYYVCTLSSKPSCLELVPVELSSLQIDASDTIIKPWE